MVTESEWEYQTIDGEQSVQNNSYIMSLSVPLSI